MQKLAEICVRRPVFATMLILSLTVVGLFSYKSLGVDLFPKIDLPTITVTVVNPGASPQEIETEITDKVATTPRSARLNGTLSRPITVRKSRASIARSIAFTRRC